MEPLVALVAGSGWAAGVNLYLTVAILGLAGRFGVVAVPEPLTHPWVVGAAVALFAVEFLADKVPYLDNLWDAVHTLVRPLGAAWLGYVLAGEAGALLQAGAAGGSGLLALGSHAAKASARAAVNTSPEPLSNVAVSLAEDGLVGLVLWLAITNPVVALVAVALLAVAGVVLTVVLWRFVRRLRRRRAAARPDGDRSRVAHDRSRAGDARSRMR